MKKVLSTALALGLVAGVATTASAAYDSFSITGHYRATGTTATHMDETNGIDLHNTNDAIADTNGSSAWMDHRVRLYPKITINDKTSIAAELRLNDNKWGTTAGRGNSTGATSTMNLNKLYATWSSPIGSVKLGSIAWGAWGTSFVDTGSTVTGMVISPNMIPKPFNMTLLYAKLTEGDSIPAATTTTGAATVNVTDADSDYYEMRLGYKTDTLDTALGLGHGDNQTVAATDVDQWRLRGYAKAKLGAINVDAEFDHLFGDSTVRATNISTDRDATAAYLGINTKAGDMTVGAVGWYSEGDNDATGNEDSSYGGVGNDFETLMIANGDDYGLFNETEQSAYNGGGGATTDFIDQAGQLAIGAFVALPVSDKMTLTAVVGSAWADNEATTWDDHYGTEIDLKMDYKLLDNLTYSVNFGYFDVGDWCDMTSAVADNADVSSVTAVKHVLNMTF